ncbi:hypothetical protein SISNIDRAFT_463288 [Sistotremastrum niveocremeum HHB9708]|uniref:Uncharacterized protein n=1 Tax=Sistotremastrum niveocremeum HHB9708 TaxID=1314777 RepID=A0A164YZ47_9AGAM|nr:hypothetical protein SISNIDRAFT_463288 [Sistotremastrum niveocremeum HHB9708]
MGDPAESSHDRASSRPHIRAHLMKGAQRMRAQRSLIIFQALKATGMTWIVYEEADRIIAWKGNCQRVYAVDEMAERIEEDGRVHKVDLLGTVTVLYGKEVDKSIDAPRLRSRGSRLEAACIPDSESVEGPEGLEPSKECFGAWLWPRSLASEDAEGVGGL